MSVGTTIANDEIMGSSIFIAAAHSTRKAYNLEKEAKDAHSTAANTSLKNT